MVTATHDMQKLIKLNKDGKADFHIPMAFEKVADIVTQHLGKVSDTVAIQVELSATQLRETLDNDAELARNVEDNLRLSFMVQKGKAAVMAFLQSTIKSAHKSASMVRPAPYPNMNGPILVDQHLRVPYEGVRNTIRDAAAGAAYYPSERMHYGRAGPPPPPSGMELCKAFAKGLCSFGNVPFHS